MKKITVEDFDKAVPEVASDITIRNLKKDDAVSTAMFIMNGMQFAVELREKLFGQEEE